MFPTNVWHRCPMCGTMWEEGCVMRWTQLCHSCAGEENELFTRISKEWKKRKKRGKKK